MNAIKGNNVEIKLPQPEPEDFVSIESVLNQRETKREYLDTPVTLLNLSRLLFAGQGRRGDGNKLTAPSAQEQYPISTYVAVNRVSEVAQGLYQYHNSDHSIVTLETGSFLEQLEDAAIGDQPWVGSAAVVVILAGNIETMNHHFAAQPPLNKRGERYNYIEVGAIAQNMQLQGIALNIGMVLVGGFNNDRIKTSLNLPPELEPSALLCFGNL